MNFENLLMTLRLRDRLFCESKTTTSQWLIITPPPIEVSSWCYGSVPFQAQEQNHQINHEQQHDRYFQYQHPAVGLIVVEQLIEISQGLELSINGPMPIGQMESGRNVLVNARQVPIAEEFCDVGKLIAEAGQVNADFPQLPEHDGAPTHWPRAQIAVRPIQ